MKRKKERNKSISLSRVIVTLVELRKNEILNLVIVAFVVVVVVVAVVAVGVVVVAVVVIAVDSQDEWLSF